MVTKSRPLKKERRYNEQKKNNKRTNNDLKNYQASKVSCLIYV